EAFDIHGEDRVEIFLAAVFGRTLAPYAGGVHQRIEPARFAERPVHDIEAGRARADVAGEETCIRNVAACRCKAFSVMVSEEHAPAFARNLAAGSTADAAGRPADESHFRFSHSGTCPR